MKIAQFLQTAVTEPSFQPPSAWLEHGPFATWLIRKMRPRHFVELGAHFGYSYFAVCETVLSEGLSTRCVAVDTWQGDEHAGFYSECVFEGVQAENERYATFSTLLRKTFNNALVDIEDGSVDLLHLDGRHFYEDVREDYENWLPKLAPDAVILFHDTEVRERGFGVCRLWAELRQKHPSFNFVHGNGLGVLCPGKEVPEFLTEMFALSSSNGGPGVIEDYFQFIGSIMSERVAVRNRYAEFEAHITQLEADRKELRSALTEREETFVAGQKTLQEHKETLETGQRSLRKLEAAYQTAQQDVAAPEMREARAGLTEQIAVLEAQLKFAENQATLTQEALRLARRYPLAGLRDKLVFKLLRVLAKASPPLSPRTVARFGRSAAKRDPDRGLSPSTGGAVSYAAVREGWARQRAAQAGRLAQLREDLVNGPLISVVVPVYNPDPELLAEMIESVRAQSYPNWELCLADDCSSNPEVRQVLRKFAARDPRVRLVLRETNGHISNATNSAIEIAEGAYLALLDHDDLLDPDALLLVAKAIADHPDARVIYTDEDKIAKDGTHYDPHFKPDWNRELLYGINYISHLGVYDADLVRSIGGFRKGFEGAQDYDLLLCCIERLRDDQIVHIPKVLYAWRATPGSTVASNDAKPYATAAGRRALAEHLERVHAEQIEVIAGPFPLSYRALWPIKGDPLVSIIIPTRDHLAVLRVAVETIVQRTAYENFEVLIVDNGSVKPETLTWFDDIMARDDRVRVLRDDRPFNYSAINNAAVTKARGEFIALVNNDVEVIDPGWLTEVLALAQREGVGCVGAKLSYPDGRVQHGGVGIGIGGVAGHFHLLRASDDPGYFCRLMLRQELCAVTAACLLVRRSIYDEVGGLNETELTVAFNDVDFCLKVRAAGYHNLWSPWAQLIHHESISRGYEDTPEKKKRFAAEANYMRAHWRTDQFSDPFYNPNLSLHDGDFNLAVPSWQI